ncbi:MAG: hypothetical protein KJ720_07160 [Proteobacteria bacterium]|nr:hypothetical protein [Pseudomonadota bacterium]MBU1449888.1 hypothetical protein [Pseudomonadota bacterium]
MNDKKFFIEAYFEEWDTDLKQACNLLSKPQYLREGVLLLSCYIGAFGRLRFPDITDRDAYKKILLEYSGMQEFFELIDILFFYNWPKSTLKNKKYFSKFKQPDAIFDIFNPASNATRYISKDNFIAQVKAANVCGLDEQNLRANLDLFSLAEICYQYIRCTAVHEADFPLFSKTMDNNGNVFCRLNHAIDDKKLFKATRSILQNLRDECLANKKWPGDL